VTFIEAWQKEIFMGKERDMVITAYGHDRVIDKFLISVFARDARHNDYGDYNSNAKIYCGNINALELKGNSWVHAAIISENIPYAPDSFLPLKFDVFLKLDDMAVQKVLREVDSFELARALKNAPEAIKEKIFSNMSKRAVQMIKEDLDCMGPLQTTYVKESREKIVLVIRHLAETGEIIIHYSEGDTVS
jgi:hypothetical protein